METEVKEILNYVLTVHNNLIMARGPKYRPHLVIYVGHRQWAELCSASRYCADINLGEKRICSHRIVIVCEDSYLHVTQDFTSDSGT